MTIRSGFFNSVSGDRKYDAGKFAEYFASFIGNGVFPNPSTGLQVAANDDMTITVKAGKAWIKGYILVNDDDYILNLDPADGVLNRIDRIVARYDTVDREIRLEVKKGAFASSPVAPALQRDADAYELALADIAVNKGAISITQASITDLRLNTSLCGIVHGTVDQVDTTTLATQYQTWLTETQTEAETNIDDMMDGLQNVWDTWFATIQGALDGDVAGNLLNLINANTAAIATKAEQSDLANLQGVVAVHLAEDASLADSGHIKHGVLITTLDTTWDGISAPYSKEQTINGIIADDIPIIDITMSGTFATDEARIEAWGYIYRAVTAENKVTFYATDKPSVDLPIQLKVVR